jgi:hypothetical protein
MVVEVVESVAYSDGERCDGNCSHNRHLAAVPVIDHTIDGIVVAIVTVDAVATIVAGGVHSLLYRWYLRPRLHLCLPGYLYGYVHVRRRR